MIQTQHHMQIHIKQSNRDVQECALHRLSPRTARRRDTDLPNSVIVNAITSELKFRNVLFDLALSQALKSPRSQ
jgi:hypothetical protein